MIQKLLLGLYKLVSKTGFLKTSAGQWLFYKFYFLYKEYYEAKNSNSLKQFITPHSSVIDVGANAGFFTKKFAGWISDDQKVFAFEPEPANIRSLKSHLNSLLNKVVILEGVAGNRNCVVNLYLDPYHPAGHKISSQGIEVKSFKIDDVISANKDSISDISLIKIDVQGAEKMVLEGARDTIDKYNPTLFVEIDEEALKEFGTNSSEIFDMLSGLNYTPFYIDKKNKLREINYIELEKILSEKKYTEILFQTSKDRLKTTND